MHNTVGIEWKLALDPIMRGAGKILMDHFGASFEISKKHMGGLVTSADLKSEAYLIEKLLNLFPEASIFAEESGKNGSADYCWVIDPLDGTTNFAHNLPYFCVSVALTYKDAPVVAAIFQPTTNEFFYAEDGKGAWLNDTRLAVSQPQAFSESLIALGLPYGKEERLELIHATDRVVKQAFGVRHLGAAALDLAQVACGRFDGLFFTHLGWWDVAAGMLLIAQAGGKVTDFKGNRVDPSYVSCIGGGLLVHEQLADLLKPQV
jgi:myo-inositol-1(or 4)-monophosphatase